MPKIFCQILILFLLVLSGDNNNVSAHFVQLHISTEVVPIFQTHIIQSSFEALVGGWLNCIRQLVV